MFNIHNNTYNAYYYHIWNYHVRKQQELPGVFLCRFLTIFHDPYWSRGPPCLLCASIENIVHEKISIFISDFEKLNCFSYLKGEKGHFCHSEKFFEKILKNLSGLGWADLS